MDNEKIDKDFDNALFRSLQINNIVRDDAWCYLDDYIATMRDYLKAQGYGHIPTAIREFAERVKNEVGIRLPVESDELADIYETIDEIVKEYEK